MELHAREGLARGGNRKIKEEKSGLIEFYYL